MGGNALSNIQTIRLKTDEYNKLYNEIKPRLQSLFNTDMHLVQSYRNKPTHGDMDVMILNNENLGNVKDKLYNEFRPQQLVSSGSGIWSFDIKNFQIDIIASFNKFDWNCAKDFYDYDPSGMIIGSTCHSFNLKYGAAGLYYVYRSKCTNYIKEISLSKNTEEIFKFLDYDYNRFRQGFNTLEEIFDFCISSKYFSSNKFDEDDMNRHNRKRNAKRKTFNAFVEYIKNNNINKVSEKREKEYYIDMVCEAFSSANVKEKIAKCDEYEKLLSESRNKFTGDLVMQLHPDLQNKLLGEFITKFKESVELSTGKRFMEWTVDNTKETVINEINNFYKTFKK